jgi:hypothetical protein
MPAFNKHFVACARRTAIELWRAKVPQRDIIKAAGYVQGDPDEGFGLCGSNSGYLQNLVASMPRRLAEVIEKDGWTIHY